MSTQSETFEQIYVAVHQFYARHIFLMDEGRAEETASTFTEDATLVSPPKIDEPVRGRVNLLAGLRKAADDQAAQGIRYRRCHSMISVEPRPGGELFVRAYVQVVKTVRDEGSHLHAMCVCEDVLVRQDGELKIRERSVVRDDHPRAATPVPVALAGPVDA